MAATDVIKRRIDLKNLVRELSENRTDSLEVLREALSNAKDHQATRFWLRSAKDARNRIDVLLIDDGEGMNAERLEAFWGVGASSKSPGKGYIGYKGHGTKLYFDCDQLSVATSAQPNTAWRLSAVNHPKHHDLTEIPVSPLEPTHRIHTELETLGLLGGTGTAILLEGVRFNESERLLQRQLLESYCDWFTVIGDVRSGLFDTRKLFHDAVASNATQGLQAEQVALSPIAVRLRINGEPAYTDLGIGSDPMFGPWPEDTKSHARSPGLVAFGHRFADQHVSGGVTRVRDDLSAIRLTSPTDWVSGTDGISIVARVEGHRRQRETYKEASWQNHPGARAYSFEERFGLWLCRDFIPILRRNELLQRALDQASGNKLRYELGSLRNWQIFVNHQSFLPTANRTSISNEGSLSETIVQRLADTLAQSLKKDDFREWVDRLRAATLGKRRADETGYMDQRREEVRTWYASPSKHGALEIISLPQLTPHEDNDSLLFREPKNEQEVFYLYALVAGRYRLPLHIVEYDATRGVDAIALLREKALVPDAPSTFVRVELKNLLQANSSLQHFFVAIDVVICWRVARTGDLFERDSSGEVGRLQRRAKSVLSVPIDTHEIEYDQKGTKRLIPVIELSRLWETPKKPRGKR